MDLRIKKMLDDQTAHFAIIYIIFFKIILPKHDFGLFWQFIRQNKNI